MLPLGELDVPDSGAEGICIISGSVLSSLLEERLELRIWKDWGWSKS